MFFFVSMFSIFLWDGAFWFGKMLLFGDMALFHWAKSFRKKVTKKKKEHFPIYYLFLLTKKVFLECAKKKKIFKTNKKILVDAVFKQVLSHKSHMAELFGPRVFCFSVGQKKIFLLNFGDFQHDHKYNFNIYPHY